MLLLVFVSPYLKENQCLDYILSRLLSHFLSNKYFFKESNKVFESVDA